MATVSTTTNRPRVLYDVERYVTPCGVFGNQYLTDTGYVTVTKNAPERRVKPPPGQLLDSLTARATQSIVVSEYGHQVKLDPYRAYCAATRQTYDVLKRSENYFAAGGDYPTAPYIDWALKARIKIKANSVGYAETIGEYKEAISYLTGGASILKRAYTAVKWLWKSRRHRKLWFKRFRKTGLLGEHLSGVKKFDFYDVVGTYLAIQFGITPIISQLQDSLTSYQINRGKGKRMVVSTGQTVTKTTNGLVSGTSVVKLRESKRVVLYIHFRTLPEINSGNLAEALWAGTRLSFIVDWFYNIGEYLSSLDALSDVVSVKGVVCTRRTITVRDDRVSNKPWSVTQPARYRSTAQWREVVGSIPQARGPATRGVNSFSFGKLLSAMAILLHLRHSRLLAE